MMDISNVSYKHVQIISTLMIGIGCCIVFLSFRNTVSAFANYSRLKQEVQNVNRDAAPAAKHSVNIFENDDFNETIFNAVGVAAKENGVTVKKINNPVIFKEADYLLLTEEITLEGDFAKMLRCMDAADEKLGLIKIVSLKFERDRSLKSETLMMKAYFQMIKSTDDVSE